MNDLMTAGAAGLVTMTSLELVDFINEQRAPDEPELTHANFLAKVPKVLGETSHLFECDLPDSYGRPRRGYRFPKREACLMAMSYSYELQAKVFDRMTALEEARQPTANLPNFVNPAEAARAWAEQFEQTQRLALENQAQAQALVTAAPKVEFVDRYALSSSGAKGFRQVCKLLGVKEPAFRQFLKDAGVMYLLGGEWTPHAQHVDAGRFETKAGVAEYGDTSHAYNQAKFTAKGVAWIAGEWARHQVRQAAQGGGL